MRMKSKLTLGLMTGFVSVGLSAEALNPMVVTPTRTAQTVDEANAAVTVISRDDIERSSAVSIEQVLRSVPGLTVANSGGIGKQSSVFIRGANSDHVLVLVDGMKVGGATAGTVQFENIPLALVDHIEVVRGPRSSLYGSEAIGGVIQIFTRRGTVEPEAISEVAAGNNGTSRLTQHFSGSSGTTRYSLSASMLDTDGVDSQTNAQPDDDGFNSKSVAASLDQLVTDSLTVGANFMHAQGENEYDNASDGLFTSPFELITDSSHRNDFVQQSGRVFADYLASDELSIHAQFGFGRETNDNYRNEAPAYDFTTKRRQALVQADYSVTQHQLVTLGVERIEDEVEASTAYVSDERYNNAVFTQWQTTNQPLHLQAALRYDDNQAFGDQVTGGVSAGYQFDSTFIPYVSYGTGFKAPDFNELYYPGFSNPDLEPETSDTYEAGLKGSFNRMNWELAVYRTNFDDLILSDANFIPQNIAEATAKGAEASFAYVAPLWELEVGAGYTRAVDDDSNEQLARRPKWNGRIAGLRRFGPVDLNLELIGQTPARDLTGSDSMLPGFVLTNVSVAYAATEALDLGLKVQNLLDQEAVTAGGYTGATRQLLATLRYTY